MILKFPDLDTLRLALTSGAVPPAVSQAGATAGLDGTGPVWVETQGNLSKTAQADLRRLGVLGSKVLGGTATPLRCWPQVLPLIPDADPLDRLDQTPFLFEIAGGADFSRFAAEVLRLGNDRQFFRWFTPSAGGDERALLRVAGPPYYSLLRAVDHQSPTGPVAYRERAPRVWVEVGWNHPLADRVKPPAGKLLLMRPPRQWTLLDEAPFRDIYEVMEFTLPAAPLDWGEGNLDAKVRVAPKLTAGGPADGAELWVLRGDGAAELNRFVQNADDQMLHRLAFAVGELGGCKTVVLRVRPSKLPPPVLVLDADAYKHYLKLPNLFLPAGSRLHPPLRRDKVRELLASDPDQLVWLAPTEDGRFTPQTLPESAFRPLADWVDYVLDRDHEALTAWVEATRFDFEAFICDEDLAARPKKPPLEKAKADRKKGSRREAAGRPPEATPVEPVDKSRGADEETEPFAAAAIEPSEAEKRRRVLEEKFLAVEGGLDAPQRQALWPELAMVNATAGSADDAGVCWMHALWAKNDPPAQWAWEWFRAEAAGTITRHSAGRSWAARATTATVRDRGLTDPELNRLLGVAEPATADVRALAAYLTWAASQRPAPRPLLERLNAVRGFLEAHERLLPVRAQWLAWRSAAALSGGDSLALARARDRLLERLYVNGLRPDQDLPGFLHFGGEPAGRRLRGLGKWMLTAAAKARDWIEMQGPPTTTRADARPHTKEYSDLLFAYGLARLGERDACAMLRDRAGMVLADDDVAHFLMFHGFNHRIQQALDGKASGGPLPADLVQELDKLRAERRQQQISSNRTDDYAYMVERMREVSRIFEPDHRLNPYRHTFAGASAVDAELAALPDVPDRGDAALVVARLLRDAAKGSRGREERNRVVRAGLDLAPRVGEEFARGLLDQALARLDADATSTDANVLADQVVPLLEKALFVAAHFDSLDHVHQLVARFRALLQSRRGSPGLEAIDAAAAQCFRGLRKLGMRQEVDRLLDETAEAVLGGRDLDAAVQGDPKGQVLRSLLYVAAGWLCFERQRRAAPVLRAAHSALLQDDVKSRDKAALASAYVAAVGQMPAEAAQKRLLELFERVRGVRDSQWSNHYFSQAQLKVIESVVLAILGDNFVLGADARRWLDDDEYLIRRRVHADVRASAGRH
jgi:hypothetical protein